MRSYDLNNAETRKLIESSLSLAIADGYPTKKERVEDLTDREISNICYFNKYQSARKKAKEWGLEEAEGLGEFWEEDKRKIQELLFAVGMEEERRELIGED